MTFLYLKKLALGYQSQYLLKVTKTPNLHLPDRKYLVVEGLGIQRECNMRRQGKHAQKLTFGMF
jgi:hypothetical protein